MKEWVLVGSVAGLLGIRLLSFIRFWKIPFSFGADRFFGLPVQAPAAEPLLRQYRALLWIPYLPDALCALAALHWGGLLGLLLEQLAAAVVTRVSQTLLAIHTIRQAKWLAVQDSWKPVKSVALSLKARRLRDYANLPFELVVALLMVGVLSLLTYHARPWQEGAAPPHLTRVSAFTALAIYLQLGGLLVKQGLVKWRMWLPGERTEEY